MSCKSLTLSFLFWTGSTCFVPLKPNWTCVSPMRAQSDVKRGFRLHKGPRSSPALQITRSACLFLLWLPPLHLCNFSLNVFSSLLLFPLPSAHASICPSILPLYFPSCTMATSHPPDRPLFCPAVLLFQTFNICSSSLLSSCF